MCLPSLHILISRTVSTSSHRCIRSNPYLKNPIFFITYSGSLAPSKRWLIPLVSWNTAKVILQVLDLFHSTQLRSQAITIFFKNIPLSRTARIAFWGFIIKMNKITICWVPTMWKTLWHTLSLKCSNTPRASCHPYFHKENPRVRNVNSLVQHLTPKKWQSRNSHAVWFISQVYIFFIASSCHLRKKK